MSKTREIIVSELQKIDAEKQAERQKKAFENMSLEAKKAADESHYSIYEATLQLWQSAKDYANPDERFTFAKANDVLTTLKIKEEQEKGIQVLQFLKEFAYPRIAQIITQETVSFAGKAAAKASGADTVLPSAITGLGADLTGWVSGLIARALVNSYLKNSTNPTVIRGLEQNANDIMQLVCQSRQKQIKILTDQMLALIVYIGNRSGGLDKKELSEIQKQFINAVVAMSNEIDNDSLVIDIKRLFGITVHSPSPLEFQQMMFSLFATLCEKAYNTPKSPFNAAQEDSLKRIAKTFTLTHEQSMALTENANQRPTETYLETLGGFLHTKPAVFLGTPQFWRQDYANRTGRNPESQWEYNELTVQLILKSDAQYNELLKNPNAIIPLLANTKEYLAKHSEFSQFKDFLRWQFKEFVDELLNVKTRAKTQGKSFVIDEATLLAIKQYYVECLNGSINDFELGKEAYQNYLKEKQQAEEVRQDLLTNCRDILLGSENYSRNALAAKDIQKALNYQSPTESLSSAEIESQLALADDNATRAKAQSDAHNSMMPNQESTIDYGIRGSLYFAADRLVFSLKEALGAETKTLAASGTEFDVSTYKQIEHLVKTDLLERTTKWVTKNYLTHETALRTSWSDSTLTGGVKDFVASVTATVSSAIIGEIFYRCFPPENTLNDDVRQLINQAREEFFAKHRDIIDLISTEILRVIIYIKNTSDVTKVDQEMNAILSQINQAIAVLANSATKQDSILEKLLSSLFPDKPQTATPLQLQQTIYQLCSDLCVKTANAINDNAFSQKAAAEVKTATNSLLSVPTHLVIGTAEAASELFTSTSALYVFNKVQRTQLQYMADRFDASSHILFSEDLYANSIKPDNRFNSACSHLLSPDTFGFFKTKPLAGASKAWLLDYQVRTDPTKPENKNFRNSIKPLITASEQQTLALLKDPKSLIEILAATKKFLDERTSDAEILELVPKLRLQLLELTIQIQEYYFAEKVSDETYRQDAIQALGEVKRFYTDVLQGDAYDIINARDLRANQAGIQAGIGALETILSEEKASVFLGSPALWLASAALRKTRPHIKFSGQNPVLTSSNVDRYITSTIRFIKTLAAENEDLFSLYRLFLIKQIAEYITPGTVAYTGNAYVRGALEEQLLSVLFNGKISYPILDDIARLEYVNTDFNATLLQLIAYLPDQSNLFALSMSQGKLANTTTRASDLHKAIDEACKKSQEDNLALAKQRASHTLKDKKEDAPIDPFQDENFVRELLDRQLKNKIRSDSLNTRRDINASTRLSQVRTSRDRMMGLVNLVARTAGSGIDVAFDFQSKQSARLFQVTLEKNSSFFENIAKTAMDWGKTVLVKNATSWIVQDSVKPILIKVKNVFAPQTNVAGDIAVDYATQAAGWLAGIFAERFFTALLNDLPNNLDEAQRQAIEESSIALSLKYQTTIKTIADRLLTLIAYIKACPNGVDLDELNGIVSQLNGAIAALCQDVALQPDSGLKDLLYKITGKTQTLTPNELQKELMLLCVDLCENASQAEAQGLLGNSLKTLQAGNGATGVAGNLIVSAVDFSAELVTNRRLVTEFNSLQRSTLKTLANKLTFQANTLDTRLGNESINRLDEPYLQQVKKVASANASEQFFGSPQSWTREYRRYVSPTASSLQDEYRLVIEALIKKAAVQSENLLRDPNQIILLLQRMAEQKDSDYPPNYTLQVREQLLQLVYGLEKNLMLLADNGKIAGISDPAKYVNNAAIAIGHIKYHYVSHFKGDASDIDNALRLRFSTPMLMEKLLTLQSILEKNPLCCRGAQSLWLSAEQTLDLPLPSHMMNAATLTPQNIRLWLDNTRQLLKSLSYDPQLVELYRMFVIKQICELSTERFDSFIQFATQDFLNEMGLDYSTIQAIATFSETQFDFTYSFQAMLAFMKDTVSLAAKNNIYSEPLIAASERVSSFITTQRLVQENREKELKELKEGEDAWSQAEKRHERSQAISAALYRHVNNQEEKSTLRFTHSGEMKNYIAPAVEKSFDELASDARRKKAEAEFKTMAQSVEEKSHVLTPFIGLEKVFENVNITLNKLTDTETSAPLSLAKLDIQFSVDEWQKIKQFVLSSAARDGGKMVAQAGVDLGSSWLPPGVSTMVKLSGGFIATSITGLFLQKATGMYFEPKNSLNTENQAIIEKSVDEHKDVIGKISTEMLRLLVAVGESGRTLTEKDIDALLQPFLRGIVVLVTQALQHNQTFFELLKLRQRETTTSLELIADILELCKTLCNNADRAIKNNPFAMFFDIHQFKPAQREALRILTAKFDHVIKDIRYQEQLLSLAHLKADENYNNALEALPKKILLGDANAWLTDFYIRSPDTTKDEDAYRKLIENLFQESSQQTKDLITHPQSIQQLLEETCQFLEDKKNIAQFAHPLALQAKIRQQILHIGHGIIQHLQAMATCSDTLQEDELIKIQNYTRDAMIALSSIRKNYSRLGGDPSDFENILQLSHATHKVVLEKAFSTLQSIIDPKKLLVGSGIIWLGARPEEKSLHNQTATDLEKLHSHTVTFIQELEESHKPQLAQLYRLLVIKQLAELIANRDIPEELQTKLARDILPSYGITSYLAIYEIANIGRIQFDLQDNLITLVGLVSDQLDMQQLAKEMDLNLSPQLGDPIDAMIRSALVVDTLRDSAALSQSGNVKVAIDSTVATMNSLNSQVQMPFREPKPAPPVVIQNKKASQAPSVNVRSLVEPILDVVPKKLTATEIIANWFADISSAISRLFRSCFPKKQVEPEDDNNEVKVNGKNHPLKSTYADLTRGSLRGSASVNEARPSINNAEIKVTSVTQRSFPATTIKTDEALKQPLLGNQTSSNSRRKSIR